MKINSLEEAKSELHKVTKSIKKIKSKYHLGKRSV